MSSSLFKKLDNKINNDEQIAKHRMETIFPTSAKWSKTTNKHFLNTKKLIYPILVQIDRFESAYYFV